MKNKLCTYCHSDKHKSWQCFDKPRKVPPRNNAINRFGKQAAKWMETRNKWLQANPPRTYATAEKGWLCHYCTKFINIDELTLDHKYARSGAPELRYDLDNLVPCCSADNTLKKSMDYDVFCAKYYPRLLRPAEEFDILDLR